MNALIFGINGQDGYYLTRLLLNLDIEVIGVSRTNSNWIKDDVSNYEFVEKIIKESKPNYIFHLAANSTTRHEVVFENHETISTGTLNILECAYKYSPKSKVFLSGSGLQFVNRGLPIKESDPFEASSAYCISRIQSAYAGRYYRTLGMKVYIGYFFNHDSPLRSERHVNQQIVSAVKRIASGSKEKIELGDISVKKEFTYAEDTVEAVWQLVQNDTVYESVIGSGKAYSIEDWLSICFKYYNLNWKEHVVEVPFFKAQYEILVSDPSTLNNLGWMPKLGINELAKIMINYRGTDGN